MMKLHTSLEIYKCRSYLFCNYELLKKSTPQIAKECVVNPTTIRKWLKKFNIRIRAISEINTGENHPQYKGNDVKNLSVRLIHKRIAKIKPKPTNGKCQKCHQIADEKGRIKLVLSNLKNHNYTLNPNDYQWVHESCHTRDDWTPEKRKESSKRNKELWTLEKRKEQAKRMKENNPMRRPEVVKKWKKTMEKNKTNKSRKTIKPEEINSAQLFYWLKEVKK